MELCGSCFCFCNAWCKEVLTSYTQKETRHHLMPRSKLASSKMPSWAIKLKFHKLKPRFLTREPQPHLSLLTLHSFVIWIAIVIDRSVKAQCESKIVIEALAVCHKQGRERRNRKDQKASFFTITMLVAWHQLFWRNRKLRRRSGKASEPITKC